MIPSERGKGREISQTRAYTHSLLEFLWVKCKFLVLAAAYQPHFHSFSLSLFHILPQATRPLPLGAPPLLTLGLPFLPHVDFKSPPSVEPSLTPFLPTHP